MLEMPMKVLSEIRVEFLYYSVVKHWLVAQIHYDLSHLRK